MRLLGNENAPSFTPCDPPAARTHHPVRYFPRRRATKNGDASLGAVFATAFEGVGVKGVRVWVSRGSIGGTSRMDRKNPGRSRSSRLVRKEEGP